MDLVALASVVAVQGGPRCAFDFLSSLVVVVVMQGEPCRELGFREMEMVVVEVAPLDTLCSELGLWEMFPPVVEGPSWACCGIQTAKVLLEVLVAKMRELQDADDFRTTEQLLARAVVLCCKTGPQMRIVELMELMEEV